MKQSSYCRSSDKRSFFRPRARLPAGQGFTLVEILITIIIMGILAVLGISMFMSTQKKGRDFNRKAGMSALSKALESYMNDKGVYPPSTADGKILWCGTADDPTFTACLWGDPFIDVASEGDEKTVYMSSLPKEETQNESYFYEGVEDAYGQIKGYRLYAQLENEKDPEFAVYGTDCGSGDNCNFVLTSENVPRPTPILTSTPTPTLATTSTPTSTPAAPSTPTPTPECVPRLACFDGIIDPETGDLMYCDPMPGTIYCPETPTPTP